MVCFTQMLARLHALGVVVAEELTPVGVESQIDCMRVCVRNSKCSSFFFNQRNSSCYLSDRQVINPTRDPLSEDVKYFVMLPDACPFPNYQYHRRANLCLGLSSNRQKWNKANEMCIQDGARLVKIDNEEKYTAVIASIKESSAPTDFYFIGASDTNRNGTWFWTDGSLVEYKSWRKNPPTKFFADKPGRWLSRDDDELWYICEKVMAD